MNQSELVETIASRFTKVYLIVAWLLVGLPLGWGVYETLTKSLLLFR
jgi:hypothetical protein